MKTKVKLETEKEVYLSSLKDTDHVGFIDKVGRKGFVANIGSAKYSKIMPQDDSMWCNDIYPDNANSVIGCITTINLKEVYLFTTYKELYQWLAE